MSKLYSTNEWLINLGITTDDIFSTSEYEKSRVQEDGTFYSDKILYFRDAPNQTYKIQGTYVQGGAVTYDLLVITNKYAYISWISSLTGTRRYMAVKDISTQQTFGRFL